MPTTVTALMADPAKKDIPFQIRCTEAWLERVKEKAEVIGLSAAAYIRMIVSQHMDTVDEQEKQRRKAK